jgi:hypothetical protein
MHKLFSLAIILLGISALGTGIGGLAVNAWAHDWRGWALSAAVLAIGVLFVDSGRYALARRAHS